MNCKWCNKFFHPSRKFRKYCSLFCRNSAKKNFGGKKKGSKFIRTKYWSTQQNKTVTFKSSYELTYANFLNMNNIPWLYEPKKFYLEDGKHYYLPDFYLPKTNEYHEVKGKWFAHSIKKVASFRKLYPDETLIIVGTEEIMKIRKSMKGLYGN